MSVLGYYGNSGDLIRTPQHAASDQGLYCFLTELSMKNTVKNPPETPNLKWTHPNDKDGQVHWSEKG